MSAIVSFDIDIKSILNNELSHFQNPRFWPHHINAVISVSLPKAAETVEENRKGLLSGSLLNQILYNKDTRGWRLLNQLVNWQNIDEGF